MQKTINDKQKRDPRFKQELKRARLLLTQFFEAFDQNNHQQTSQKKQLIFSDFPEMYVDIIKFEQWHKLNQESYNNYVDQFENPVERLIAIKKDYLK